jgi:hypothetical protein
MKISRAVCGALFVVAAPTFHAQFDGGMRQSSQPRR